MTDLKARLAAVRERIPWLDHAIRAYGRYTADAGDRLAAAVSYFGFLSVFPLLALAFSVLGYVIAGDAQAQASLVRTLQENFPGLIGGPGGIDVDQIVAAKRSAGIIGLVGLLFAGLGWIDALRDSIRTLWHQNVLVGNFVVKKLRDIVALVGLGIALGASLAVTALVTAATSFALRHLGIDDTLGATVFARVLGFAIALLTDTALFVYLFTWLPRLRTPWRRVLRGAVLGAVLFEILKLVGTYYIKRTTHNPVYGTVAVSVGLLVWINLVSRILLMSAAWVVTAAGRSDVSPSGTSSPEAARKAGIPQDFVATVDEPPPALIQAGAPSPLLAAIEGKSSDSEPGDGGSRTAVMSRPGPEPKQGGRARAALGAALGLWLRRRR
ncbi:MAG: YihY/virulence factor BrkB family protein [Actinomycetota bacterium]|nr:YihY/virulence factor BrkB family protein [Actinomycetota bacterium]